MTHHLIRSNLPIYYQCLSVPTEWTRATKETRLSLADLADAKSKTPELDEDFLRVRRKPGEATSFDPWEKRSDFFRLKRGDSEGLLKFLATVGLFEAAVHDIDLAKEEASALIRPGEGHPMYKARYMTKVSEKYIWEMHRLLIGSLNNLAGHTGKYRDIQARIVHSKNGPQVILTTTTFLEAVLLTLAVDKVERAKVSKCARPDCGVPFSATGGHKRKYCSWYCGHIESVRKARRKTKQADRRKGK